MLSPIIDELSGERTDVAFYKINTDENTALVQQYDIMSIPTILFFENGVLIGKTAGFKTKEELKKMI